MVLQCQSFDTKTINIFNRNHKIDYYRKMQSYFKLSKSPNKLLKQNKYH